MVQHIQLLLWLQDNIIDALTLRIKVLDTNKFFYRYRYCELRTDLFQLLQARFLSIISVMFMDCVRLCRVFRTTFAYQSFSFRFVGLLYFNDWIIDISMDLKTIKTKTRWLIWCNRGCDKYTITQLYRWMITKHFKISL